MRDTSRPAHVIPWLLVWLVVLWFAATPVLPAEPPYTYRYVDDEGVTNYTDQWHLIPDRYQGRSQILDSTTGKVLKADPRSVPQGSSPQSTASRGQATPASTAPPFYAGWHDMLSRMSIPLPSRSQWIVELAAALLVCGAILLLRRSTSALVRLLLKGVIMAVLIGGAYVIYLTTLTEGVFGGTTARTSERTMGKDILQGLQGTTEKAKEIIQENAVAPLQRIKDATVGEAVRTRDLANHSSREKEKALKEIGAGLK